LAADARSPSRGVMELGQPSLFGCPLEFPPDPRRRNIVGETDAEAILRQWGLENNVRALWTEPIVGTTGQVFGVALFGYTKPVLPDSFEIEVGTTAARLSAIIIEKARAEEQARKQMAELAHVARLATMGEMASGLAHELNQPLCAIVNFIGASIELLDAKAAGGELRQAMAEVARQAERAGEVIRRVGECVGRREPQRVPLDLNEVVREVVGLTRAEMRQRQVGVKLHLAQRLPRVLADPIQIQQVMVNLVRNAIDAMEETPPEHR